jgi:Uma2 family endonuclease
MQLTEPRTFRWTREQYHGLADLGYFQDRRVELLDGEIVEMPVPKNPHVVALSLTEDALRAAFGGGYWVRTQAPLDLGPASEPAPDLAVVPGKPRDYTDHPTTALLVVEISDTTLSHDRGRKSGVYAAAGIADYWIVNLVRRRLEVFRRPISDSDAKLGWRYATKKIYDQGDAVAPLAARKSPVAVADMFP